MDFFVRSFANDAPAWARLVALATAFEGLADTVAPLRADKVKAVEPGQHWMFEPLGRPPSKRGDTSRQRLKAMLEIAQIAKDDGAPGASIHLVEAIFQARHDTVHGNWPITDYDLKKGQRVYARLLLALMANGPRHPGAQP